MSKKLVAGRQPRAAAERGSLEAGRPVVRRRPDIVLVMTDQQRHDQTGYASGGHFETPNLDRWAAAASVFDQAHSASTTCVPARVSLLTGIDATGCRSSTTASRCRRASGRSPTSCAARGVPDRPGRQDALHPARRQPGLRDHADVRAPVPRRLHRRPQAAPRRCSTTTTSGCIEQGVPDWRETLYDERAPGAPLFPLDAGHHPTDWIADEAVARAQRARPRPAALPDRVVPPPPRAAQPAEPYASMYDRADVGASRSTASRSTPGLPDGFLEATDGRHRRLGPGPVPSEAFLREYLSLTRGLIRQIDDATGRVLDRIDRGRDRHDLHLRPRRLRRSPRPHPQDPVDALRRPHPGPAGRSTRPTSSPGRRIDSPVTTADLALTCLDYAGVDIDLAPFDSRSLRPLLTGRDTTADRERTFTVSPQLGVAHHPSRSVQADQPPGLPAAGVGPVRPRGGPGRDRRPHGRPRVTGALPRDLGMRAAHPPLPAPRRRTRPRRARPPLVAIATSPTQRLIRLRAAAVGERKGVLLDAVSARRPNVPWSGRRVRMAEYAGRRGAEASPSSNRRAGPSLDRGRPAPRTLPPSAGCSPEGGAPRPTTGPRGGRPPRHGGRSRCGLPRIAARSSGHRDRGGGGHRGHHRPGATAAAG